MKKIIITSFLFWTLFISNIYSNTVEISNEKVFKNPKREVTTINANKNKDCAEMNITINKINIKTIKGIRLKDGILFSILKTKEDKSSTKEYKIVSSLVELQQFNKQKKILNVETPVIIKDNDYSKIFKSLKFKDNSEFYMLEINKNNKVIKAYKIISDLKTINNSQKQQKYNFGTFKINKNTQIQKKISNFIELLNLSFNYNDKILSSTNVKFADEYITKELNKDISSFYISELSFYTNQSLPGVGNMITVPKLNVSPSNGRYMLGNIVTDLWALYNTMGATISGGAELGHSKIGIYFDTNNIDIGEYQVNGEINVNSIGNIITSIANILIVRDSQTATITIPSIAPKNVEYDPNNNIHNIVYNNLHQDLSYRRKSDKTRIVLNSIDSQTKVEEEENSLFRTIILEKNGCKIKLSYKQDNNNYARPIITKLVEANGATPVIFNIKVKMLANDNTVLNGVDGDILNIKVEPKNTTNIGEVIFNIDKRIQSLTGKEWIKSNGNISQGLNGSFINYSNMINKQNNYNIPNTDIADVLSINGIKSFHSGVNSSVNYKIIKPHSSSWQDESAMPYNIPFNRLSENLVVSKNNSSTSGNSINNMFILKGTNNLLYEGNIKENYIGENAYSGTGVLDLTSLDERQNDWVSWNISNIGQSGDRQNTNGSRNNTAILKMENTKLFDWTSQLSGGNTPIVTKLEVTNNNTNSKLTATGRVGSKIEVAHTDNKIGIDNNGLYVHKTSSNGTPITYHIKAYYNEVVLGELTLTITNGHKFSIEGIENFNFGNLIPGKSKILQSEFILKGDNVNIISLNIPEISKMTHVGVEQHLSDIPLEVSGTYYKYKNNEIKGQIKITATPPKNAQIGSYSGEINLVVTIE